MRRLQRKLLSGLAVAALAVGCGVVDAPQKTSSSSATSTPMPANVANALRLTAPRSVEGIDAILQQHRFTNAIQQRVTGSPTSLDVNVRAKRRAMAVPPSSAPHSHKIDWEVLTGSPVHIGPAGGGNFEAEDSTTFLVFGVDSLNGDGTHNASGGISSGVLNPNSLATSTASLFVINNLYTAEPTLAGAALSASSASFGYGYLVTDANIVTVYGLSREGNLYCFSLPTLSTCTGSWPYSVGSTVTWSAPYPEYNYITGAVTSLYFGDDAGKFHCVEGSGANSGLDCWAPAQLATTNPQPIGEPIGEFDSVANAEIMLVGDDLGRFFRVEDTGVSPVAGSATVAQADICGVTNGCTTNPYAIRTSPALDSTNENVYVASNGSVYQFPLAFASNWQVVASKQLFTSPNGPIEDSPTIDSTNSELYVTARSTLYKLPFSSSGLTASTPFSTPLVNQVTSVPANNPDFPGSGSSGANSSAGTDSFPRGFPYPYYDSLFVGTGTTTASTGLIEQYGCLAAAQAPPLNNITTQQYGAIVNTGVILDNVDGNINFGFGTGGTIASGGFVQYPAGDPVTGSPAVPGGWACPTGDTTSTACGATTCISSSGCVTSATCPVPANASAATCVSSVCGFTCETNYADCDGNPANGCEVDYETDVNNCGGCSTAPGTQNGSPGLGLVCSTTNITATCVGGVCGGTCTAGFSTCGGTGNNGCPDAITCGKNPSGGANGCCTGNCDFGSVCTNAGSCAACVSGNDNSGGCDATDALPIQCVTILGGLERDVDLSGSQPGHRRR